jgi:hypothetical protein
MLEVPKMTTEKPDVSPVALALSIFDNIEKTTGFQIIELRDFSLVQCLITVNPGIETIVLGNEERVIYRVAPHAAANLAVAATGQPEVLEAVKEICASNIFSGEPIPEPLRATCYQLLRGTYEAPKKPGRLPGEGFGLFWLSVTTAWFLKDVYELPLTRGDGMEENSAADIVCEALTEHQIACRYTQVRDWLDHSKHASNRVRAQVLSNKLRETYLFQLGVLQPRNHWWLGPYGPSGPLSRTRRITW